MVLRVERKLFVIEQPIFPAPPTTSKYLRSGMRYMMLIMRFLVLFSKLNAKGKGKGKSKGKDKSYIPKPKNPKPSAKEHPTKDDACHHYKEVGHCKRNYPAYLAELIKKKKQVGTASSSAYTSITPQHNGVSERRNRNLLDMVDKIPYELWYGKVPKLSYLKVWGYVEGFKPPKEEVVFVPRSARTHRTPDCLSLNVEVEEHSLGDLNEPNNYKAALLDPESDKWVDAMKAKMQSIKDNQVWCLVDLPSNLAKVYTQTYEVDYKETFSPIADIRAIWILIATVAFYDYEIWKMDVKNAFFNCCLNEDIYMVQPEGFVDLNHPKKKFILRLGIVPRINEPIKMFCDNSAALLIANEPGVKRGARHYHRRYHYVRECMKLGEINLLKVHTDDNLTDPFTKALSKRKLTQHVTSKGIRITSSFMWICV
nr:hypothetical protein [Tanacetum cinerariifolium]